MSWTSVVWFGRLISAAGLGAFLGAAVAGAIAVVTGQAFAPGSTWAHGLPVLIILGAAIGTGLARLSRRWFLPKLAGRYLAFAVGGTVAVPLAAAFGQLNPIALGVALVFLGGGATFAVYVRALRKSTARSRASRAHARPAAR